MRARLKLNEIYDYNDYNVITMGSFNNNGQITVSGSLFKKVAEEVFSSETFFNGYKNLIQVPKFECKT
jgi:hypothetical protein